MAGKEYKMLFKLGAQIGSNFTGTFSSAQKVLQKAQQEINALNKTQSDISAYQRQQTSIEKTNEKLALYQKQLENVRKEKAESATYSSDLANKEEALKQRIKDTERTITDKTGKLQQMENALKDAGIDTNNLTQASLKLGEELGHLTRDEEKAAAEAANFGEQGQTAFEMVGSALVAAGITSALKAIADEYKECVSASMEFDYTMSTVEALSGASVSEMRDLTAAAKEYGATTVFTANQSAEAMTYMGMAGWKAQNMISGMPGVLNLAASSGEDLATVSDIVTDNLTAFKLKASDAAHFADVLAAAAANSNTSVGVMGETFKQSASIAGALGYSIEDVAIQIGLMANSGVKASIAGTALKNIFNGISKEVTLTSRAFGEITYTGVNLDGSMKDLSDVVSDLRVYFDQMTDSEKKANAQAIAGERGYNGLLAMLNATEEDYNKVANSINNCTGAAQRMANIKLDNLQGDVTLLESATDGLRMTIGGMFEDEMREGTQVLTDIVTKINEFCEQNPAVVKALMAVTAEIGLVVAGYTAFVTIKKTKNTLDVVGTALAAKKAAAAAAAAAATGAEATATVGATVAQKGLNLAFLTSPIFIITAAVAALTAGFTILREACKVETIETQTLSTATKQQYDRVDELNSKYEEAVDTYGETSDQARALKYDLDEATQAIENQSFSVKDLYAEIDTLHGSTEDLLSNINETTSGIDNNYESAMVLSAKLRELASSSDKSAASQAKMEPIVKRLNEMYPELGLSVEDVADRMGELNAQIEQAANSQSMQAKYEAAKESLADLYVQQEKLQEAADKADTAYARAAKAYSDTVGDNVFSAFGAWISGQEGDVDAALNNAREKMSLARDDLNAINAEIAKCEAAMAEYGEVITGTSDNSVSAYDAMSIAISNVTTETEELLQAYNDAYQAAYESVAGQYALWDEAAKVSAISAGTINTNLQGQADYWSNYNANLDKLLGKAGEIDGLKDVIATFADGSADSVNAIAGMATASDEDLTKMVENWKKVKEEQDKTAKALADTKVDFKGELDEIAEDMKNTVDAMNLDSEAKKAAEATIKAYADAIKAGQASVTEAANIVAAAVASSLNLVSSNGSNGKTNAYASGTEYAESGYALVGEEGPELVRMSGGERVYTASDTRAILNGGRSETHITISPQFTINGADGLGEERIREMADRLLEMVQTGLEEANTDRRRSVYA